MKCGEADKRNAEYYKVYKDDTYFLQLITGDSKKDIIDEKDIVIFDVGAHNGESAEFFNQIFNNVKIYSFEPNPSAAKIMRKKDIANVSIFQLALSNVNGSAGFNVQDISHLSSLNPINIDSKHSLGYAKSEKHTEIDVQVARGDDFCKSNNIKKIDLLKIDVQANEVDTLTGFSGFISYIRVVFVEVSFYDFYTKRSSIKHIEEVLPGFEIYDIFEVSKNPKTLGTDWATLVYKNTRFMK